MIQYFQSKLHEIQYNYSLALEKNDIDGVHDLRVAIKRMKAFFNLVESISGDFNAGKKFRNFRKIAKNTGGLRDSQVQQILLKKMQSKLDLDINEYEIFLKKLRHVAVEKYDWKNIGRTLASDLRQLSLKIID